MYEIRVYNQFGKQNFYNAQVVASAKEANYQPDRVIDLKSIFNFTASPNETVVFLNGGRDNIYDSYIMRYNYGTREVEAFSNNGTFINGNGRNDLKVINSSVGQELMYLKYDGISVYD
ncbi:MAG: hypothetical protein RIM68_02120, partial [Arenibacter sp.]